VADQLGHAPAPTPSWRWPPRATTARADFRVSPPPPLPLPTTLARPPRECSNTPRGGGTPADCEPVGSPIFCGAVTLVVPTGCRAVSTPSIFPDTRLPCFFLFVCTHDHPRPYCFPSLFPRMCSSVGRGCARFQAVFAHPHMYPDTDVVASFLRLPLRVSAATWCVSTPPPTPLACSPVRLPRHCPSPHPIIYFFLFFLSWVHPSHATPPRFFIVRLARYTQRRWCMRSCRQACVSGGLVRWLPLGDATRSARHRYLSPYTNLFCGFSTPLPRQRLRRPLSGSSGVGRADSPGCGSAAGSSFPVGRLSCFFFSVRTRVR